MREKHIAVFTPLVGGHVYPALGLCSELVNRGHRVTYPSDESFASRIRSAGATPIEFKTPELNNTEKMSQGMASDDSKFWRVFTSVVGPMALATAATAVEELDGFYRTNPPDLVLYDWFAFGGRILATRLGCPAAQIHAHFAHRESLMRLDGVCTTPEPLRAFAALLDSFMSTYGIGGRGHLWHYENLNIIFVPRKFQYDVESFDDRFRFVGATHNRRPRAGAWERKVDDGRPILLISEATSGTDGTFLRLCVDAFAKSKYHVVVSKASNTPEILAESMPHNFEINRTVLNGEILPYAKVMLCQGGMGTTLDSLYHGVPVVALPLHPFNSEVAHRMVELGLGSHIPPQDLTASTLRKAVDMASSDESLHRRVKQMQADLANGPGVEEAVQYIEDYVA